MTGHRKIADILMTISTDVVIVGAGPCGIFQIFELGLLGMKAEIIDSMRVPGGQCAELYPDKPIYDIPAIPVCSAQELVDRLMEQVEPFGAGFHMGEEVTELTPGEDGLFRLATSAGKRFEAKAVVVAGGVGSFQPRRLRVSDADQYEGSSLHYAVKDPARFAGKHLVILGGGDSALDWVMELCEAAASLTLVHRRDEYRAMPASVAKMKELVAQGKMQVFESARAKALEGEDGQLSALTLTLADKSETTIPCEQALVFFGLAPKLGPIADWGLQAKGKTVPVDTEKFQTALPGVFAVGDINTYPGKKKLILSGFHEAALAAFAIKQHIEPDKKVYLQYTTTSPLMHERLGVADEDSDE